MVINRKNVIEGKLPGLLAEESAHSLVKVEEDGLDFSPDDLKRVKRPYKGFGTQAFSILHCDLNDQDLSVITGEFFPPIGLSYLFQDKYKIHLFSFAYLLGVIARSPKAPAELKSQAGALIVRYLPQLAAVILLDLYESDSVRLLADHPDITKLKAIQLWEKYCWPLLTKTDDELRASLVRS